LRLWLVGDQATVAIVTEDGAFALDAAVEIDTNEASGTCACDDGGAVLHLLASSETTP
jgi:hypothetical protein